MKPLKWIPFIALVTACAQVRAPEGGPKDVRPPELLSASPENGSTRFTSSRIVLRFNERVQLSRVRERLLISPPLSVVPEVVVSGGTDVVIALGAPLAANRTYTFNIGEVVSDLSEGNVAQGVTYVVSTGDHLDSLAVHGRVVDAATGKALPDVLVLLRSSTDTGDVRTSRPNWFSRTDGQGRFTVANLPAGPKWINALKDRNGNYRYDLPTEEVAFRNDAVEPGEPGDVVLRLFTAPSATQFVAQASVLAERGWQMTLARPASELELRPLDREEGKLRWWPEWNASRDTVVFWPSDTTLLSGTRFALMADTTAIDTLVYRISKPMPFYLALTAGEAEDGSPFLRSTRPIKEWHPERMKLERDTVQQPVQARMDSSDLRVLHLVLPGGGKKATLTLLPDAVTGVMGGTNDTTRLELGTVDAKTLGKLTVILDPDSAWDRQGPYILQLLTAAGRVVREARCDTLPATIAWDRLPTGPMTLRMIEDRDDNGRWTTGSFAPPRQPEPVLNLLEPVIVRAGWTIEKVWRIAEEQ